MSRRVTTELSTVSTNELRVDEGTKPTVALLLGIFVAHVVICVAPCVAARVSWVVSWVASGGASRRAFRRLSCGVGR
jgi:hypothetical protein